MRTIADMNEDDKTKQMQRCGDAISEVLGDSGDSFILIVRDVSGQCHMEADMGPEGAIPVLRLAARGLEERS
jgi:hypothetical protein